MKTIALAALASTVAVATPASAGIYANVESNGARVGSEYTGSVTDVHVGYEGGEGQLGYYVQAGPAFVHTESASDTETEFSGKVGLNVAATESLGVYGEIAGISNGEDSGGDTIIDWGAKVGAKFTF